MFLLKVLHIVMLLEVIYLITWKQGYILVLLIKNSQLKITVLLKVIGIIPSYIKMAET